MNFREWLINRLGGSAGGNLTVDCSEISAIADEIKIRELAFNTCVNLIGNAVGKCVFETYKNGTQVKEEEYYLWNFEPNANQNSTAFIHQLIYKLYQNNEALVIEGSGKGIGRLFVADDFTVSDGSPALENTYENVTVDGFTYSKKFNERDVLHFRLNGKNVKPVIDALYSAYNNLISASVKNHNWSSGKHLKVEISQIAQASPDFEMSMAQYIDNQVKPFLSGENGVLPEYEGYKYSNFGGNPDATRNTRDIRYLIDDVFTFTANAFGIPPVLLLGDVAGTADAVSRWLTTCIDPLCDQLAEEITRKRYGYSGWKNGNFLRIDTSKILHFDMFGNASNIEKLIGSGVYSVNEVRTASGQPTIPEDWADRHLLTKNISTLEEATNYLKGGE